MFSFISIHQGVSMKLSILTLLALFCLDLYSQRISYNTWIRMNKAQKVDYLESTGSDLTINIDEGRIVYPTHNQSLPKTQSHH